jgi:hypothetical protein
MKKSNIKSYDDIRAEIIRLEVVLDQQQNELKSSFRSVYNRSHPLTIAAQFVTGSFKDVKNDRWVRMFNLVMYAYNEYTDVKSKGVDNPFMEMVMRLFNTISNGNESDNNSETISNDENI